MMEREIKVGVNTLDFGTTLVFFQIKKDFPIHEERKSNFHVEMRLLLLVTHGAENLRMISLPTGGKYF